MVVGLVIAKYVSPNDLGLWTTINLAVTYSLFLQAGLINGMNRELPYAYGKGEDDKAKVMAGTVQSFTTISSIVILVIGLSCFLFVPVQDEKIKYGILAITIFIMLSYYQNYLMSTFRSKSAFLKLAAIQIVDVFVNLTTLILVAYYSYYGMIVKAVLAIAIYVFLLHISRPIKIKLLWNKNVLLKLLKVGLPIFGLAYIVSISSTADKLWLLKYSDLSDVGLYSFGCYVLSIFSLFSMSVATYIYPRMTFNYGKTNDKSILWQYVKKITLLLLIIQTPLAIIGFYLIPGVITLYFSKYILSIGVMQILLFAGVFIGSIVGVNALWSMKSWKYIIIYQLIYSALLIGLTYMGIKIFQNKLEGVAYGVLFANLLNLISGLYLTYTATHNKQKVSSS